MKLSKRSQYGVRLMIALGARSQQGPVFLKDIARSEEISEKYLSQIIIPLKSKGLVIPFRGAHGGYTLGREAITIRMRDIIEPLEGQLSLVDCVVNDSLCDRTTICAARDLWCQLHHRIVEYLDEVTLEDLVVNFNRKKQRNKEALYYSI